MSGRSLHTKKVFQRSVSALLFLFIAAVLCAPFLVNSQYGKSRISNTVLAETGINVTFSKISISFFPGFHIALSDIRTRTDDKQSGSIENLLVYPDLSSLLKGRIIVTKVVLKDFEARKLIRKAARGKAVSPLSIRDAMERFAPFIHKDKGLEIVLESLHTRFFTGGDTSVRIRRVNKGITGKILLKDFEVKGESFQTLFSQNRALPSAEAATADIQFSVDQNGSLSGECKFVNLVLDSAQESDLTLNPEETILSFDISADGFTARLTADSLEPVLQKPEISFSRMSGIPSTKLKFGAEKVKIDPARTYATAFIGKNAISRNIFSILESGISHGIEVAFSDKKDSELFDPENLTIKGTLRSGRVNIPQSGLTAYNVAGRAFMKDGTLDLEADSGTIRNSVIHQGTVSVELLSGPEVPFTSRFSLKADLRRAPATLSRLIDKKPFAEEMNRITIAEGSALVDLFLEKKRKNGLKVEVDARDIRLKGRYDRMHDRIEIFDGSFFYKNKTARIDHVTAGSGGIYLYDTCMDVRFDPEPVVNVRSGKALLPIKEILPYLVSMKTFSAESFPFSKESGTVWIDSLNLTLPLKEKENRDLRITGEAKNIKTLSLPEREGDCTLGFEFTASGRDLSVSHLTGRVKDLHPVFELTGSPFVKGIRPPFEIINGKMEIEPGKLFFTGKLHFPSGPSVEGTVTWNRQSGFTLEHLCVKDQPATRFDFDNTGQKPDFEGFIRSSTLEKIFTPDFLSGFEFMQLSEEKHFLISFDKDRFLKLDAYRIELAPFLNQKNENPKLRKSMSGQSIRIKTRYLDAGGYRLKNVEALLDIKTDKTVIQLLKADLCGIDINGTIVNKGDFLEYRADAASIKSDDLRHTAECLFKGETLMDGSYSFQGRFHSKSPKDRLKESVSGNFQLSASNGRIYRLTLLSRVLSVINVSRFLKGSLPDILQDGFEYHTFSLKADVKESRIAVNEGIIDGKDMSIIFTGDIYPVEKRVDLTFLVAPFKTVDMIVKNIPVLNTLLGGKLVSIPVKAQGSIKNPTVMPLHPSAVGTGLTDMMKNIVNTPVKLMEKLP